MSEPRVRATPWDGYSLDQTLLAAHALFGSYDERLWVGRRFHVLMDMPPQGGLTDTIMESLLAAVNNIGI